MVLVSKTEDRGGEEGSLLFRCFGPALAEGVKRVAKSITTPVGRRNGFSVSRAFINESLREVAGTARPSLFWGLGVRENTYVDDYLDSFLSCFCFICRVASHRGVHERWSRGPWRCLAMYRAFIECSRVTATSRVIP